MIQLGSVAGADATVDEDAHLQSWSLVMHGLAGEHLPWESTATTGGSSTAAASMRRSIAGELVHTTGGGALATQRRWQVTVGLNTPASSGGRPRALLQLAAVTGHDGSDPR